VLAVADPDTLAVQQQAFQEFLASEPEDGKPIAGGGRSSTNESEFNVLPNYFQPVSTDFPFQLLDVLENSAIFNRHLSYAVDNVVTLAATTMTVEFADTVKTADAKKMRAHLRGAESRWYAFTDGQASLTNDLFAQVATFGCLSAEIVPTKKLDGVQSVPKVGPQRIRFFYDRDSDSYTPFQKVGLGTPGSGTGRLAGYKELNQQTYKYIAAKKYKATPYGQPPFIAALEDIARANKALGSFNSMIDRMGMLGFLSVLVQMPKKFEGETGVAYKQRLVHHLQNEVRPQVEMGFARGMTIGFQNAHKFELQGNQMNVQGAEGIMNMMNSLIYAGLHQDPNMLGDNQATTETFGRVILAKMTAQVASYQRVVASFFEQLYLMELYLAGFRPGSVKCTFEPALIGDKKREEETEQLRIANVTNKINAGIISQDIGAAELGYDKAFAKGPVRGPVGSGATAADNKDGTESTGSGNPNADKQANDAARRIAPHLAWAWAGLRKGGGEFDYSVPAGCEVGQSFGEATDFHDELLENYLRPYEAAVMRRFAKAVQRTRDPLRKALYKLPKTASQKDLQDTVLYHLIRKWDANFRQPVQELAQKHQMSGFRTFRKDKRIFTQARGFSAPAKFFAVPDPVFGLPDYRAVEYLVAHDTFYLGRFIVDEDTRRRLLDWIALEYLGQNSPIGKGQAAVTEFLDRYEAQVQLEAYKIRRIMETTANRCRNYANLNYINQAELDEYEVVEVNDKRTCGYCEHMNGKTFSVADSVAQMKKVVEGEPGDTPTLAPFATNIPLENFKKLTAAELQAQGIGLPSYHCHCRGRVVAVI
jgi:SPP1 gp7 family putative phage head morphogenesis protein